MKTLKSLCILGLFVFTVVFTNAQAISTKFVLNFPYGIPVVCDGVEDILIGEYGTIEFHVVEFFDKNNQLKWHKNMGHNTVKSQNTGEVFKVHEINKGNFKDGIWTFHYNMIGCWGTHIHLKGKAIVPGFEIVEEEIICK